MKRAWNWLSCACSRTLVFCIFLDLLIRRHAFSVGEMSINYETHVVISSTFEICQLSLLNMLTGIGVRVYIHKDECTYVFIGICIDLTT